MPEFPLPQIESAPRKALDEMELDKEQYATLNTVSGASGSVGAIVDLEPVRKSLDERLGEFNKTFLILGSIGLGMWFLKEFGPSIVKALE